MTFNFEPIWANIAACEGQTFATQRGQAFAYDLTEIPNEEDEESMTAAISIRRRDMTITREDIESVFKSRAYTKKENGKGKVAMIYALLRDKRINETKRIR